MPSSNAPILAAPAAVTTEAAPARAPASKPSSKLHSKNVVRDKLHVGMHAAADEPPAVVSTVQLAAAADTVLALHVRGKSSLKHTKQLLDCWLTHREWPKLTVVGPMPNEQITLQQTAEYMGAGNIGVPRAGKFYGEDAGC